MRLVGSKGGANTYARNPFFLGKRRTHCNGARMLPRGLWSRHRGRLLWGRWGNDFGKKKKATANIRTVRHHQEMINIGGVRRTSVQISSSCSAAQAAIMSTWDCSRSDKGPKAAAKRLLSGTLLQVAQIGNSWHAASEWGNSQTTPKMKKNFLIYSLAFKY